MGPLYSRTDLFSFASTPEFAYIKIRYSRVAQCRTQVSFGYFVRLEMCWSMKQDINSVLLSSEYQILVILRSAKFRDLKIKIIEFLAKVRTF